MTDRLTPADPEPPPDTIVRDYWGTEWIHVENGLWMKTGAYDDLESEGWGRVLGGHDVTVVEMGGNYVE